MFNYQFVYCVNLNHGNNNDKLTEQLSKLTITDMISEQYQQRSNADICLIQVARSRADNGDSFSQGEMVDDGVIEQYDEGIDYKVKFRSVYEDKRKILGVVEQLLVQNRKLKQNINKLQEQPPLQPNYKKYRRPVYDQRQYQCKFPNCTKIYSNDVSVNLHMKLKHNYGSRLEREKYALEIFNAEKEGNLEEVSRKNTVVFLEGQLEEFRERLRNI